MHKNIKNSLGPRFGVESGPTTHGLLQTVSVAIIVGVMSTFLVSQRRLARER